jgi:hypothetical protein
MAAWGGVADYSFTQERIDHPAHAQLHRLLRSANCYTATASRPYFFRGDGRGVDESQTGCAWRGRGCRSSRDRGVVIASGGNTSSKAEPKPTSSEQAQVPLPSSTTAPTSVPAPSATAEPAATPLPDRTDCDSIRGTPYRSETEHQWFMQNCQAPITKPTSRPAASNAPAPPPPPPPAPQPAEQPPPTLPPPTATQPAGTTLTVRWFRLVSQPPVVCDDSAPVPPASALNGLCIEFQILGVADRPHQVRYTFSICGEDVPPRTTTFNGTGGQISSKFGIGPAGPGEHPLSGCDVTIAFAVDGVEIGARTVHLP